MRPGRQLRRRTQRGTLLLAHSQPAYAQREYRKLRVVALLRDGSMTDGTLGAKELMQSSSVGYSADSVTDDDSSDCYKHATVILLAIVLIAVNDLHCVLCKFSRFDRSATNAAALMTVVNAMMILQLTAGDSADDSGSAFKFSSLQTCLPRQR
eukprot:2657-Heterococcus_DN1.PRE.1